MIERLTSALDFQAKALVLRAERQQLIASNIANADTPGYVARDFDFAQALRSAAAGSSAAGSSSDGSNALGSPIAGDPLADGTGGATAAPRLQYATPSQTNLDRNTVDMDRERAAFADNALKYESTLTFINSSVRWMQDAMKSPSQG
jgi:flagellar basal-body rod protein FlgB